jgi:hypothetical protein
MKRRVRMTYEIELAGRTCDFYSFVLLTFASKSKHGEPDGWQILVSLTNNNGDGQKYS